MKVIIAWDGDHIGREVGRASLADDVEGLRRISQSIDAGNKIWESWVTMNGGSIISFGGDEGRAEILAEKLAELPKIRDQYAGAVGSTVSVGVGTKLSEADRALLAGKLQGGDKIVLYTPEVEEIIKKLEKEHGQKTEADKLAETYLQKSERKFTPAFRHRQTGQIVESPGFHDYNLIGRDFSNFESGFVDPTKQYFTREQALASLTEAERAQIGRVAVDVGYMRQPTQLVSEFLDPDTGLIKKAQPGANEGPGAGFGGSTQPSAPSQEKPTAEASEHSQGEAAEQMMENENPVQPEQTASADQFEDFFHNAAQQQQQKDVGQQQAPAGDEQLKAQVVQVLQNLKTQMPILEQVKQTAPDTYQAIMGLAQAVVLMARSMNDTNHPGAKELQDRANSQAQIEVPLPPEESGEGDKKDDKKTEKSEKAYKHAYNLALYDNTEMGKQLNAATSADRDENSTVKSFHVDPAVHQRFHDRLFQFGHSLLDGPSPLAKKEKTEKPWHDCDEYGHCWGTDAAGDYCLMCGADKSVVEPDLDKASLSPNSQPPAEHHHLNLPVGSHIDPGSQATRRVGRIKVQHIESGRPAKQGWIQARAGQVLSQDGHAISARNPKGR